MSINFSIRSDENPDWVKSLKENCYCRNSWININWEVIFTLINFNIVLLYDNLINYWTTEHLSIVLEKLKDLKENFREYEIDETSKTLLNSIYVDELDELINLFDLYVEKKCIICVF